MQRSFAVILKQLSIYLFHLEHNLLRHFVTPCANLYSGHHLPNLYNSSGFKMTGIIVARLVVIFEYVNLTKVISSLCHTNQDT